MVRYDHLYLIRLLTELPRRKRPGFGVPVPWAPGERSIRLTVELTQTVDQQVARRRSGIVDPSFILRVGMIEGLLEQGWYNVGLESLPSDPDRALILFSSSDDLAHFRRQLDAFGEDIPVGQRNPPYAGFVSGTELIETVEPRDRLGMRLREERFGDPDDIDLDALVLLDLEIWNIGSTQIRGAKLGELTDPIKQQGGNVYDRYNGPTISLLRVEVFGRLLIDLLSVKIITAIGASPQPDTLTCETPEFDLANFPSVEVLENAPIIGIFDSEISVHPLLEGVVVGVIGVPEGLGTADEFRYGTRVTGVAAFGDLRAQLAEGGDLVYAARICSTHIVNRRGGFDDHSLIASQMRDALTTLNREFSYRILGIFLVDIKSAPYTGGKVGPWAATLDELAHELGTPILISAGDRMPRQRGWQEGSVTGYSDYLLETFSRLLGLSATLNVLTVGSTAHGNGIDQALQDAGADIRPITGPYEPPPFTRVGPGIGEAIRPDLVDPRGIFVYDPFVGPRIGYDQPNAGIPTLNHRHLEQMLRTVSGTPYSISTAAHKAVQLLGCFPEASANLLRVLLVGTTTVPDQTRQRLIHLDPEATYHICGNGLTGIERAVHSDDAHVVLYAEDALPLDSFIVFEIPIPGPYLNQPSDRTITIIPAYSPPVQHTRVDYAGAHTNYRVLRGVVLDEVVEHFRWRSRNEGATPPVAPAEACDMVPRSTLWEKGSVQISYVTFRCGELTHCRDTCYLVIRRESGWVDFLNEQRYAVVVEITHNVGVQIYQHAEQRVRARPRISV